MGLRIENVFQGDVEDFLKVYERAYEGLQEYAYKGDFAVKSYFKWLYHRDPKGFFKAILDGKAVAFLACDCNWFSKYEGKKVAEVHEVVVLPEYQGKGIGKELMRRAMEYGKERERDVMELWVGIGNERARRFYESLGFRIGEVKGIWLRMWKEL